MGRCDAFGVVFQAEDGIRDLVRSRGLGDVYKRQAQQGRQEGDQAKHHGVAEGDAQPHRRGDQRSRYPVSYTHLTLPTSDLV